MAVTLHGNLDFNFQIRDAQRVQQRTLRQCVYNLEHNRIEPFALLFVPGAFTPTCQNQVGQLVAKLNEMAGKVAEAAEPVVGGESKELPKVIVVTRDNCDVNRAWQKALNDDASHITFVNDTELKLTHACQRFMPENISITFTPPAERGLGEERELPCRVAMVFNDQLVCKHVLFDTKDGPDGKPVIDNARFEKASLDNILGALTLMI